MGTFSGNHLSLFSSPQRYAIRTANNTFVTLKDGRYCRIDELGIQPGQRGYFQDVLFTQEFKLCANLSVAWTEGDKQHAPELLAIVSDQCACRNRLREYGIRWIRNKVSEMINPVDSTWMILI